MTHLADLSAVDLVAAYRERRLSPVEVTQAVIARIEASEPHLNAMWAFDPEGALAAARQSEARWGRGAPCGPIDGVPVTIKENIATKGVAVPLGTAASDLTPAQADAPPSARTREAGGVILGKTTMPDYGMLSSGLSSFHKLARNPWDVTKNPGGSSAGAGTAGAAGYGPLHIGTDIGGSVRLPAGWCALVGHKPSFGRIPIDPPFVGRVAGPMTRTVADTALFMSVLSGADARDGMCLPPQHLDWMALERPLQGVRIALWMRAGFGPDPTPEIESAVRAAARLLAEQGAIIEEVGPILSREMIAGLDLFWRQRALIDMDKLPAERRSKILPYIVEWAEGARGASGEAIFKGFAQIGAMRDACLAVTRRYDFILSPTAPMPSYNAEWAAPLNHPSTTMDHIGFTVGFNMSEQPAVSINCGFTSTGLPIGLQIAGRRFDDVGVLAMAAAYEKLRAPMPPWPVFG